MNYKQKAEQINTILQELPFLILEYPLLFEMVDLNERKMRDYFSRVNADLYLYGKADLGKITEEINKKYKGELDYEYIKRYRII